MLLFSDKTERSMSGLCALLPKLVMNSLLTSLVLWAENPARNHLVPEGHTMSYGSECSEATVWQEKAWGESGWSHPRLHPGP